jgi:hypothetical protein
LLDVPTSASPVNGQHERRLDRLDDDRVRDGAGHCTLLSLGSASNASRSTAGQHLNILALARGVAIHSAVLLMFDRSMTRDGRLAPFR